jgi:hypothetical protein
MSDVFDKTAEISGKERAVCKVVVYCLIYTGPIIRLCIDYKLTLDDIMDIRQAFDEAVIGNNEREASLQRGVI